MRTAALDASPHPGALPMTDRTPHVARARMWRRVAASALAVAALTTLGACNNKRVSRIDPGAVTDLSGRWNDTDSRLVAGALVSQALGAPWVEKSAQSRGGRPPT